MRTIDSKIKPAQDLFRLIQKKKRGNKIVFTNGCFDLLHKGHVSYLERAKKLGSILIVALNGDVSVRKLKGPSRPINSLKDRLKIIAALESVDFVTWFHEETPMRLIKKLKPDFLVKGGDWQPQQIIGSSFVQSYGGKVRALQLIRGRSTTRLIQKMS